MQGQVRDLVLLGADTGLKSVLAALEPSFTVAQGRPRRVRRAWLDSFDWRLYRAGLVLEQRREAGASELVLCSVAGERIAAAPGALKPPSTLDHLAGTAPDHLAGTAPDHLAGTAPDDLAGTAPDDLAGTAPDDLAGTAVIDRVRALLGLRALLEVADETVVARELRLLNSEEKTVARISLEVSSARQSDRCRAAVDPVRGYEAQATRARSLIAAIPAASVAEVSRLESALAARGRRPADYTGKFDISLDRTGSPTASVALALLNLADTIDANLDGVLRDIDSEFLHDLRVAVRRTRSALKLVGDALPDAVRARFALEFKWLGDLTTPVRDLDVYLIDLLGSAHGPSSAHGASSAALAPFRDLLLERRRIERRKLVAGLRSARFTSMRTRWRETLTLLSSGGPAIGPATTVEELAATRINRANKRVLRLGSAITEASPAVDLHDLRKRCKELRTVLDLFASIYDPQLLSALTNDLKSLQDCLGSFQDSEVQAAAVLTFAERLATAPVPVSALLAMGALTQRLDERRCAGREDFADAFARFSRANNAKRMNVLTATARG